jgi:hypothetical protein
MREVSDAMNRKTYLPVALAGLVASGLAIAGTRANLPQASEAVNDLAALTAKLHGEWNGQGPCEGRIVFQANCTYERIHHGPGGVNSTGTWKVRWDALPPTLILRCKTSDDPAKCGQTLEVKLIQLDDGDFAYQYQKQPPSRFVRMKK